MVLWIISIHSSTFLHSPFRALVTLPATSWQCEHANNAILLAALVFCDLDRADNILMALPGNALKANEHLCFWENLVKSDKYLYQQHGAFCELAAIINWVNFYPHTKSKPWFIPNCANIKYCHCCSFTYFLEVDCSIYNASKVKI